MNVDTINMIGVDGRCYVARSAMGEKKRGYAVRLYLNSVATTNDNFFVKELPEMQEAGIEIFFSAASALIFSLMFSICPPFVTILVK